MVTLNELMNYFNDEKLFKNEDSSFRADMNEDGDLELYGFDGIDGCNELFATINKDFDVKTSEYFMTPFNNGDGYADKWDDMYNPTVEEIAHAVIDQIKFTYAMEGSWICQKIFYFNEIVNLNNIKGYDGMTDLFGREWFITDKSITVNN